MSDTYIVHINGYPGTGKLTTAKQICALDDQVRLMDNHITTNPIFITLSPEQKKPVPKPAWDAIDKIRAIVLEFMESDASPELSFIFTNCMYDDDLQNEAYLDRIRDVANKRGSQYVPIALTYDENENKKRVISEGRKISMKMMDANFLQKTRQDYSLLYHRDPNFLTFDNTGLTAEQSAQKIMKHALSCTMGG